MTEVIKTGCICFSQCGIDVHLEDGKIVKIEGQHDHPQNEGYQCPKGAALLDWVLSPDRLKYPMRRKDGGWQRISWEEALDTIATKLTEVKEAYGAKALAVMLGMGAFGSESIGGVGMMRRFCDVYGTPNYFSVDAMCFRPGLMANVLTFGRFYAPDADIADRSRLIMVWAKNPTRSDPNMARRIRRAKENSAKLIVIDPRRIPLAKEADIHIQPRPGSDCALALGMLNAIITKRLYDNEFVDRWTVGFNRLAEHVKSYPPEKVEEITWVSAEKIKEIAEAFGSIKPACIIPGLSAPDQMRAGWHLRRAMCALQAITGNVDVPGGWISTPGQGMRPFRLPKMVTEKPLGEDEFPLVYKIYGRDIGERQGHVLPDVILTESPYPIKAMVIIGSNPLSSWGNTRKWRLALNKLDFLAVLSLFPSETTAIANLVLPSTSALEVNDILHYAILHQRPYMGSRKKVMEPPAECLSNANFWLKLAKRMGYEQYFPWETPEEFIDWIMEPTGLTLEYLAKEKPGGFFYTQPQYGRFKQRGFLTPSRRVELYSETMANLGYPPLPVHVEPTESPFSSPEVVKDYPLILTTGARTLESFQSMMHDLPRLHGLAYKSFVAEIHPNTARQYGVEQGERISVETKRGSVEIKTEVTEDIIPGVVSVPVGRRDFDINALVPDKPRATVSGVPEFKAYLCRVSKKSP